MDTPGLLPHQTIKTIIDNVTQARIDIAQAFQLLHGAKKRLSAALGDGRNVGYGHLWESPRLSDYDLLTSAKEVDTFQVTNAWRYIINQTGIKAYMTERRQKELDEQLREGTLPELTVDNVYSTLNGLYGQLGTLLIESAHEVFQWLIPHHNHGVGALKTNKKSRVGYRVIVDVIERPFRNYPAGPSLNFHREPVLRALGNVMSLLDGQGVQRYPHDLCTQLREGLLRASTWGEKILTPYLECVPYRNGHAHIKFLRHDLVDKLNQLGSDGSLPGEEKDKS